MTEDKTPIIAAECLARLCVTEELANILVRQCGLLDAVAQVLQHCTSDVIAQVRSSLI